MSDQTRPARSRRCPSPTSFSRSAASRPRCSRSCAPGSTCRRRVTLDLVDVDSAVVELGDPVMIAALAMRKLQALNLLATPGVRTTTDVVVTIVQDLDRALVQAPVMRLRLAAEVTDWDAELAWLEGEEAAIDEAPVEATDSDPEAAHFRALHAKLHEALDAVVEASGGEIRILE